jgi:hypothetical protein
MSVFLRGDLSNGYSCLESRTATRIGYQFKRNLSGASKAKKERPDGMDKMALSVDTRHFQARSAMQGLKSVSKAATLEAPQVHESQRETDCGNMV